MANKRDHARRTRLTRVLVPQLILVAWLATACGGIQLPTAVLPLKTATPAPSQSATPTPVGPSQTPALSVEEEQMKGLAFSLGEGAEAPAAVDRPAVAVSSPLSAAQVQAVLNRLPGLEPEAGDVQAFKLPPKSLPAPRPGQTIEEAFPPSEAGGPPEVVPVAPLQVLRYAPEGDVPLAPYLSITFDQPMVALTARGDLARQAVPVQLTPEPEGQWRWVGTKTLMFEPTTRFPMATAYTVVVPKGTRSATGGELAEELSWQFTTPAPTVERAYPQGGPTTRDPLILLTFDQRIDPAAVAESLTLRAQGRLVPLGLASADALAADEQASRLARAAGEGRYVALETGVMLPYNTTVTLDVGPGTPSAEGPLVTSTAQSFSFTTYGPLQVRETRCGWGDNCAPMSPWTIRFTNPLDEAAFDPAQVRVSPELPDMQVSVTGDYMRIRGRSAGRTTYHITLDAGLRDIFGQTLERDVEQRVKVGSAQPTMAAPSQNLVVLDPAAPAGYSVWTINYGVLRVRVFRVAVEDWPLYQDYIVEVNRDTNVTPPGKKVWDGRVRTGGNPDELTETVLDLDPYLQQGKGHLILVIEPDQTLVDSVLRGRYTPVIRVWVQATGLALDAWVDYESMLAWASRLSDGEPLEGVSLTLWPGTVRGKTGPDGTTPLKLTDHGSQDERAYLIGRLGDDTAVLPQDTYGWSRGGWAQGSAGYEQRWYVIDDRGMYRPGEEVHVKGWVRSAALGKKGDVLTTPAAGTALGYELIDVRGTSLLKGAVTLNALGGFDTSFTLPANMNLGAATLQLALGRKEVSGLSDYSHSLQVQEFRRPEFEVSAQASQGPFFVGDRAITTVEANYYAGGALPNADVTWTVTSSPGYYRPPNWDAFIFGFWVPWWGDYGEISARAGYPGAKNAPTSQTYEGQTDAAGAHHLAIDLESVNPPRPMTLRAEASVMDVNRQAWAASASLLVHPAAVYVGVRSQRVFVERGQPIELDTIVTDLDGNPVVGRPVTVRVVRLRWQYTKGSWSQQEVDEQVCNLTSAKDPQPCSFATSEGGTYRVTALVADAQGRMNQTQLIRWVSGGKRPTANRVEQEQVELIPDRAEYQPGDVAEVLVQAPFVPAEGLMTLQRNGVVVTERFQMTESTYTLRVPIREEYVPNIYMQVDLMGAAARLDAQGEADASLPTRPAYATGQLNLAVPPYARTLALQVEPRKAEIEPGGETVVDLRLHDAQGRPVQGAEVALIVVDESVLALTDYQLTDPIAVFYPQRWSGVSAYQARGMVLLVDPEQLDLQSQEMAVQATRSLSFGAADEMVVKEALPSSAPMPEAAEGAPTEDAASPIRVRMDFNALANFSPSVPTDADGTASVVVKVPDNLTRYRIMAVAVSGERYYGKAEATLTARLPLMVRPSAPRFLNFGDRIELPVVLQNQTDEAMLVDVAIQATNVTLTGGAGQQVNVPARDRVEVRFPVATARTGTARFQVAATAPGAADAATFELPVYTPATTEAFAVYGTVDEGAIAQPVLAPTEVYTQFGGLEISTSSTALQALTDAVLYLTEYPYLCSEQLASRILAVAALRPVLSAFQAEGLPAPQVLLKRVQSDVEWLQGLQNDDGGFPMWTKGKDSWPFYTIHATHALYRAQQEDMVVSSETMARALSYLRDIESHYPDHYDRSTRDTLTAYALYVRAQMGDFDTARARRLVKEAGVSELRYEALGWLLTVMADDPGSQATVDEMLRYLANHTTETAGAANFVTSYREEEGYLLLSSNRRADGIILEGLIRVSPQSDLIPKLVKGLLGHRKAGRWGNTQENVFILLALDKYFQAYEAQTPDFVARVWLGEQYVAEFPFRGRSTDYQTVNVPMAYVAQQAGAQDLILAKEGAGRLYYRLGLRYAPTDLDLPPYEAGFAVQRSYEAVDDSGDVWQDAEGVWHMKAGARVRVRLRMVAPARRYHVALVDPLPAGLEAMNPSLAVTGSIPSDPNDAGSSRYWWWHWTWYEHQNLRDDRAEAFGSLVWDGIHTYTYVARATTPGHFVVPPAKAEEMYSPEVFGHSGTDKVIVE
jgi:hypothetical protein